MNNTNPDCKARSVRRARILLAEDNAAMCCLLADTLRSEGHAVREAENGTLLLEHIQAMLLGPPDRVVPDITISDVRRRIR